jgi:phytoene desaturase
MPDKVTELFALMGEESSDYFTYDRRGHVCHYFWEDGTRYQMPSSEDDIAESMASVFDVDKQAVHNYLKKSARKYEVTAPVFLDRSLHKVTSYLSTDTAKALAATPQLDIFSTLDEVNRKAFGDERLVQLFNRYATYNGSDPYQTPGIMSMIPHLEMGVGTYFPHGGMVSITNSLEALARRHGVNYQYNTAVDRIATHNGRATGVVIDGETISADLVVSNMDVFSTYTRLLRDEEQPTSILEQERSSSALIFYWGINRSFGKLDLHNIFFSDSYKEEFESIFQDQSLHEDPTVYIHISSKGEASDAPPGCENWFVMINTPGDYGQDWDELIDLSRQRILDKVSRILGTDVSQHIDSESILDPRSIASKTQSHRGALYGTASNDRFAAFLRHANFSSKIKDLYFCGGSVHPGGGIPLCLQSAKIVCNLI